MSNEYEFKYVDEEEFRKKERSVRKYNMLAYKKLAFTYYPELHKGNFQGNKISANRINNSIDYEIPLPTDELFIRVHGQMTLHYTVFKDKKEILLRTITPERILDEGSRAELNTYKGVMISKSNPEKDMFKINLLLNRLGK